MPRMLGRYLTGGCGCQRHGPDCVGHEADRRWRKRIEQRQVRRDVAALLAERRACV